MLRCCTFQQNHNWPTLIKKSVESGVGSPTSEWVLVGTIGTSELRTHERVAQLQKMKQRKTDRGETVVTYLPADIISVHPYCQVVGDRSSTHMLQYTVYSVYISHETDDCWY